MREREKRIVSDFNELEEENCSLQRTLAHLKQQQLAVDALQHESARLEEESAFWKTKSEEEESIKNGFLIQNVKFAIVLSLMYFSVAKSAGGVLAKPRPGTRRENLTPAGAGRTDRSRAHAEDPQQE